MFNSVWETSVPSTTGRYSRGRPVRRATTSARDGSPSLAGSVEDISTPMNVPCAASDNRMRVFGIAASRIAYHENARSTIAPHMIASAIRTNAGLERSSAVAILASPIFCSASRASTAPPSEIAASPPRRSSANAPARRAAAVFGSRLGSRRARK